ncbi:MAG: serine/threonine-protein kinase, partial [Myxococcota bacterium]
AGARARLLREAQAMAQLRHPNVVTVFEVGEYADQVFLAMEYVAGGTLGEYCKEQRETVAGWKNTLAAFVEAGRGLVAAHERDLVHRDFKPANVLVEDDRFQVTDFGIASIAGREVLEDLGLERKRHEPIETGPSSNSSVLIGTTPYMAPELIEGGPADAASDQFAFCVALYESLYGHRPFVGDTNALVSQSITGGRIQAPRDDHGVPDWVQQAILRGLSKDPAARWPSMAALVETLESPEAAEVGRGTRVGIATAIGVLFVALPYAAKAMGPPFDRSTYPGVVGQTLSLIAILLGMAYTSRALVTATTINRKAFASVLSVLLMQLPLELTNAALDVSVVASDIMHLVLWAAMAAMFAVTVDLRFIGLAGVYLLGLPVAVRWPEHHLAVLGLTNAAFVAFVLLVWRGPPKTAVGATSP